MVSYKEMNAYSCKYKKQLIKYLNKKYSINIKKNGISPTLLMEEVYWDNNISTKQKQYIYYMIRHNHIGELQDYMVNMPAYGWDWYDCGINIYDCCNLHNSDYITKSYDLRSCKWVNRCNTSDHLLYCNDLTCKSYCAFNKQVTKERFSELANMSLTELKNQPEYNDNIFKLLTKIHNTLRKGESHNEI